MGARFRLRSNFPMQGFERRRAGRSCARSRRYGLIVADNGSDWYFQGTVDDALDERRSSTS